MEIGKTVWRIAYKRNSVNEQVYKQLMEVMDNDSWSFLWRLYLASLDTYNTKLVSNEGR